MNNPLFWKSIINKKNKNKKKCRLVFIHTPKCGGTYAEKILRNLGITTKGHKQAVKNEGITFTIIRDPIKRFESLLNYRLGKKEIADDWPKRLRYVYNNNNITLNEIVSKMTDTEIRKFKPFRTLVFWSKNVDIFITIEQLHKFLQFFGYNYNENKYNKTNVSKKIRGTLNEEMRLRISKLYSEDVALFKNVIR